MIELTSQQKAEFVKQKENLFKEGLRELEKSTGMTLIAYLEPTPQAITAKFAIVPLTTADNESKV